MYWAVKGVELEVVVEVVDSWMAGEGVLMYWMEGVAVELFASRLDPCPWAPQSMHLGNADVARWLRHG